MRPYIKPNVRAGRCSGISLQRTPSASALILEHEFREALQTGHGLQLYYQPLVSLESQQIVGFEALVRWQHPSRGGVPPKNWTAWGRDEGSPSQP